MIWVLFKKELRQNGLWFVLLGFLAVVFTAICALGANASGAGGGAFFGAGVGLAFFFPIALATLAHLLVTTEFGSKTQLFLEALPLPRWRLIALKWALGLFLAVGFAYCSMLIVWLFSMFQEVLSWRFAGILAAKSGLWATFMFGFFFVMGFLGRYRIPIFLAIAIVLTFLSNGTLVSLSNFPPFGLINLDRFGFEREVFPVNQIVWTAAFSIGWIVFSFILGLAREGSVSAILGQKMSYREKMFIGSVLFGFFIGGSLVLSKQIKAENFDLPGGLSEVRDGVSVKISSIDPERPIDESVQLASRLAESLAVHRGWLGIPPEDWPTLYVVERIDLENEDGELLEPGHIENKQDNAVLMYANYRAEKFERMRFEAAVVGEALQVYSYDRVAKENRWWLVCGLQGKWELGALDPAKVEPLKGRAWITMAGEAVEKAGLEVDDVLGWLAYQEEVTWQSADAVAWMGMCYLNQQIGDERIRKLAREVLVHRVTRKDSRAVLWDYLHPVQYSFEKSTGIPFKEFVEGWREYIQTESKKLSRSKPGGNSKS